MKHVVGMSNKRAIKRPWRRVRLTAPKPRGMIRTAIVEGVRKGQSWSSGNPKRARNCDQQIFSKAVTLSSARSYSVETTYLIQTIDGLRRANQDQSDDKIGA